MLMQGHAASRLIGVCDIVQEGSLHDSRQVNVDCTSSNDQQTKS